MNLTRVYIVTGDQGEGKTSFLLALADLLKKEAIPVGGILAKGEWINAQRSGFQIVDVASGKGMPLASVARKENWISLGKFFFNPEAISFGNALFTGKQMEEKAILVLDEIGPFDMQGKLWSNALHKILSSFSGILILSVRKKLVQQVIHHWNLPRVEIISLERVTPDDLAEQITECLRNRHKEKD